VKAVYLGMVVLVMASLVCFVLAFTSLKEGPFAAAFFGASFILLGAIFLLVFTSLAVYCLDKIWEVRR